MKCCSRRRFLVCLVPTLVLPVALSLVWEDWRLDCLIAVLVMLAQGGNAEVQGPACSYLSSRLANQGAFVQDIAGLYRVPGVVVRAMRRHPQDVQVQVRCGNTLEGVALFNRKQSLHIADVGGIDAVIDALRAFPKHREVQKLTSALSSFNDLAPENRPIILEKGGMDLIFEAMHNFYNDSEVLFRTGCSISATSGDKGVAEFMAREGRIEFLMQMMRDHLKSYRVGQEIMQATRNMMHLDVKHREALLEAGFLQAAVDTIRAEMHERGTPTIGSTNLAMLAFKNKTMQDALFEAGALELILEAMDKYSAFDASAYGGIKTSEVWPTMPAVASALWCISYENPAVQERLVELGLLQKFPALMGAYSWDWRFTKWACATLRTLTAANKTNLAAVAGVPDWCQQHLRGEASHVMDTKQMEHQIGRF